MDGTLNMRKLTLLAIPFMMLLMAAGDPQGFAVWTAADLKARAAALASQAGTKSGADKMASEKLADYGNYNTQLAHREASGTAELHEKFADIFVIQSGEATVVVGGKVDGSHQTAPGEIRGTGVSGGERHRVSTGDVVHIPANTPHQMLVDAGHQVTYFVVKVESR
jgi:mannose-6-phosphate isomerase-like protein (cupin superfamily)